MTVVLSIQDPACSLGWHGLSESLVIWTLGLQLINDRELFQSSRSASRGCPPWKDLSGLSDSILVLEPFQITMIAAPSVMTTASCFIEAA